MQGETASLRRRIAIGSLWFFGVLIFLFGAVMLLAAGLAMGPEDEVPLAAWAMPLVLGTSFVVMASVLAPRSPHRSPPGGW